VAPQVVEPSAAGHDATEKKRRWGLAVLLLIIGAGAAAARTAARDR